MGHDCCSHDQNHHDESGSCCGGESEASSGGCCGGASKAGGGCCKTREPMKALGVEEMQALPSAQLISRFRRGIEVFDRRVFDLTEEQIDQAFLPDAGVGRWPVRVLLGHIADADLAWIHRMRRAVAEDNPVFAEWDENAFVDSNIYGNEHDGYADDAEGDHARVMHALGGPMAVIHTLRQWGGGWLLTLTEAQLDRAGMHPTRGPVRVRQMLAMATWHLEHHASFLKKKLDLLSPEHAHHGGGCCGGH